MTLTAKLLSRIKKRLPGQQVKVFLQNMIYPKFMRQKQVEYITIDLATLPYMGFGATIAWLHIAYVAAAALKAKVVIFNPADWKFGGGQPHCALNKFIEISVQPSNKKLPNALEIKAGERPSAMHNMISWGYYQNLDRDNCLFGYTPNKGDSLEEFRQTILRQSYIPTFRAKQLLSDRLLFLPNRYIAWHVRRGDKTAGPAKEDSEVALEKYLAATIQLIQNDPQPPKEIVICSDSEDVISQANELVSASHAPFKIVSDPSEKRWDGYCALHRQGEIEQSEIMAEEIITAQKIIEVFRLANYLVGCDSSYLYRVGSMLNEKKDNRVNLSDNKVFRKYYPL